MEEQEIELIDYLNVIWKRKVLIIGGTVLAAAAALVVSLSMPKTYEVYRTLKIGELAIYTDNQIVVIINRNRAVTRTIAKRAIERREDAIDRLMDQRVLKAAIEELHLRVAPKELAGFITIDSKHNSQLRYKVQAHDPETAARIADWLAKYVILSHKKIFDAETQLRRENETELARTIHAVEQGLVTMKGTLEELVESKKVNSPVAILLQATINERERRLTSLQRELRKVRVARLRSENTSLIAADTSPQHPVKPKVKLNVVLGGTVGLMMFTFLAFFLEYIEKARRREG